MGVFEVPRLAFPEHTDPGDHTRLHRRCGHLPQALQKALGAQEGRKGEDFVFFFSQLTVLKVMEALTKMYDLGKELNWKIPDP